MLARSTANRILDAGGWRLVAGGWKLNAGIQMLETGGKDVGNKETLRGTRGTGFEILDLKM
jgi:hypothetical protein